MVIQAADAAGIYIPRFCYHDKLSVAANCRMCLVEVEKAPKPLPACATPVAEGMKVFTRSARAIDAQKGTMEFLLINHPLDCPICDQGGECELQDLAVGYGGDVSRFSEKKRVVPDKNLGPLIATDMTRCIHCTRCVRFGQEIAGIMELGATGRGEHMEIGTYIERSVSSELSGNVIDLCPVGALTSKPFRYSARSWELAGIDGIAAHDAVGSNITLEVRRNRVMRVLPRNNESINECWLSDRDRFSYEALGSDQRLNTPMVRQGGELRPTDWQTALEATVEGLRSVIRKHGADQLGALVAPGATLEEGYLVQKILRALGSDNVDHRLRQGDFRGDTSASLYPGFGVSVAELERRRAVLLIGSNVRKEQPIIGLRLRKARLSGASIMALNPVDYDLAFGLEQNAVVPPLEIPSVLARIARLVADAKGVKPSPGIRSWAGSGRATAQEQGIAEVLVAAGEQGSLLLGQLAITHEMYSEIQALAAFIAATTGASCGVMQDANSAGAWLAGAVPHRAPLGEPLLKPGRDARSMIREPIKGYMLLGVEPELDCIDGSRARDAVAAADFVVALSPFVTGATQYAHVVLPIAAFSETGGSYVNGEGRLQTFTGAVTPPGEARPAWKVLRVLGNMLGLTGFDYIGVDDVRGELGVAAKLDNLTVAAGEATVIGPPEASTRSEIDLERIYEVPLYVTDMTVRRAPALQACADNPQPAVRINSAQAERLGLAEGIRVNAHMGKAIVRLNLEFDERVPMGCILIPGGYESTAVLGGPGVARVVRA